MRTRGVPRCTSIYTSIMAACVRSARLQDAVDMYSELLREGLEPSVTTWHTLMDAFGQLRQWQNAVAVLDLVTAKVHCPLPLGGRYGCLLRGRARQLC